MSTPFVSIIIPCRNEEKFIGKCLDSVFTQDYPSDRMEVLIAEGMSTDKTRAIVQDYAARYSIIRWFDNPRRIVPTGLNVLMRQARGEVIVRMDAHTDYPKDYISKCVRYLIDRKVDNVGGICITLPESSSSVARAIALTLSSGFGAGNSYFRTGGVKEPRLVDTVPFGCFRRDVFNKIGFFDEDLVRNQDDEFNARLIKNGGKILLVPEIISKYYARGSFGKLWRMYFQYGYFKPLTVMKLGGVMTWRQLVPAFFVCSLVVLGGLAFFYSLCQWLVVFEAVVYVLANALVSFKLALRERPILFPYVVAAFIVIHFSYGIGYLKGIVDFVFLKRHQRNKIPDMAISR